jgi:hypothetical protein
MLTISRANSIHFVKTDGLLPNAENTLSFNERYGSFGIQTYCQKWDNADVVTVQCVSDDDTLPTVEVFTPALSATITPTLIATYAATSVLAERNYFEFDVDFSSYTGKRIRIRVTQGTDVWESEYQEPVDIMEEINAGDMVCIQYTNKDNESKLPNVQIDYTTGIEFFMYVEAVLKDIGFSGEDEVFTNISSKVLIESSLFKTRKLATAALPEYMTDKIAIAGKCYTFLVNELSYTTDGLPEVSATGLNLRSLTWTLQHSEILGFTTDDKSIQLPTMDGIITRNNNAIVSTWTFIAPAGYMIHTVVAGHGVGSAGEYTVDMGYTLHGTDILDAMTVPLSAVNTTAGIHDQAAFETDTTVYVEIAGTGAVGKIYVQLLRNSA